VLGSYVTVPSQVSAPNIPLPGSQLTAPPAPVYIDGIPAALATPPVTPRGRTTRHLRFWSSQPRPASSAVQENYYVSTGNPVEINYLTFDLAHFPQQMAVYWQDSSGSWQPVLWSGGTPVSVVINGSVPSVVNNKAALAAGLNPYHYGAGHWVHYDEIIQPVITSQLLFTFSRSFAYSLPNWVPPVDASGHLCPYPVGLRDLDFGYLIRTSDDVPWTSRNPGVITERMPFDTTDDVHGSPCQVAVRENRATDLLQGATWRSEPQLRSDAVVCLYCDSRSSSGQPQVIDRFYLDPVTSGVKFNMYYSPGGPLPDAPFTASDAPLLGPSVLAGGSQLPTASTQGLAFPNTSTFMTISATAAGINGGAPWWAAIAIQPQFSSASSGSFLIVDAEIFQLWFKSGQFTVTSLAGTTLAQWTVNFSVSDTIIFAVVFDGQALTMWISGEPPATPGWQQSYAVSASTLPTVPAINLGGALPATVAASPIGTQLGAMNGNFLLTALVIKQELLVLGNGFPPDLTAFAASPSGYVYPPGGSQPGDTTANSAVRFHPLFVLGTVNPYGFVGGINEAYETCSWIPVLAGFTLSKGFIEFDPVLASVFKFEFTSLQAEPFDYIQPVTRPIITMTTLPLIPSTKDAPLDNGVTVNMSTAPQVNYADTPFPQQPFTAGSSLPREAMYATSAASADLMTASGGSLYNFQPFKPATNIPGNVAAGQHAYGSGDYQVRSRVAYFVAISDLTMYRVSYSAQDDTEQYRDYFADLANVGAASAFPAVQWNWTPGFLTTPAGLVTWAQVQSTVFNSDHTVTGVQFATTQTDPVQILADPDFASPGIPEWASVGDALPVTIATGINTQLGAMAQITRNAMGESSAPTTATETQEVPLGVLYEWQDLMGGWQNWSLLQTGIGTWLGFLHTVWTPEQYTISIPAASYFGGIGTIAAQPVSNAGRINAAARVFAPQALTQPLALQILDGLTGAVLAEADDPVAGGVVTEWFAGYTLGSAQLANAQAWLQVQAADPYWNSFAGTWQQADTSIEPLGSTVNVRLIQRGITSDTWYVDNISLFDEGIVWNFSNDGGASWHPAYDIRNNPRGVMMFPPPAQGTGNQLMWQLQGFQPGMTVSSLVIRPWYTLYPRGVPSRPAGIGYGPNLTPGDYYPPVAQDPHWQAWDSPIPQTWYFAYQALLNESGSYIPAIEAPGEAGGLTLGTGLAITAASQAVTPPVLPVRTDMMVDVFTDYYGIALAGDVYTDVYDDVYGADYLVTTGTVWPATAALQAASSMSSAGTDAAPVVPIEGAAVGMVPGNSIAVTNLIAVTGQPLAMRRLYLGNKIPVSLAVSLASYDAGVRKVFFDFQPDATTTPVQLDLFLSDCSNNGLVAAVSLWSNPQDSFVNPQDFFTICQQYVPIIRKNGYQAVFVIDNDEIVHNSGISTWYPGDQWADAISAGFFCEGPVPGDPGVANLNFVSQFAALHGKPLGLAEFGADWSFVTPAQGTLFLQYVLTWLKGQLEAGNPVADCAYLSGGTYNLTDAPAAWVALYKQIAALLATSYTYGG
jgi:hypothetical protein